MKLQIEMQKIFCNAQRISFRLCFNFQNVSLVICKAVTVTVAFAVAVDASSP